MLQKDFANKIILTILSDLTKSKKKDGKDNTMDDAGQYFQVRFLVQIITHKLVSIENSLKWRRDGFDIYLNV